MEGAPLEGARECVPFRERRNRMDKCKPVILETLGRCRSCGRPRCASPACFRSALADHERPPVLMPDRAESLIGTLVNGGWPRQRARRWVRQVFTVPVA